ncbi:MAG: hypothetical protein JWN70_6541 [Planctomycetaceae bacterium]|nr:hypothetical protein [Planctomycetaceae bacterium]
MQDAKNKGVRNQIPYLVPDTFVFPPTGPGKGPYCKLPIVLQLGVEEIRLSRLETSSFI